MTLETELAEQAKGSKKEQHIKQKKDVTDQLNRAKAMLEKLNLERARIQNLLDHTSAKNVEAV